MCIGKDRQLYIPISVIGYSKWQLS
jgi:hypothetical protein